MILGALTQSTPVVTYELSSLSFEEHPRHAYVYNTRGRNRTFDDNLHLWKLQKKNITRCGNSFGKCKTKQMS
jgi:hypothetical protein